MLEMTPPAHSENNTDLSIEQISSTPPARQAPRARKWPAANWSPTLPSMDSQRMSAWRAGQVNLDNGAGGASAEGPIANRLPTSKCFDDTSGVPE